MGYATLSDCINDLERNGHLIRIKEEVDPELEMAAIHLRVFENNGPAILYENIRNCQFQAISNLFGNTARAKFIFRDTLDSVQKLIELKANPDLAFKKPFSSLKAALSGINAFPKKILNKAPVLFQEIKISDLPQIKCWPDDGGSFITLPQVYTEDIDKPGIMNSNLGMYRIQLAGNDYISDKEIGLHYQLHRGIGVHQTKTNSKNQPLRVSIFIGGPPSHTFSAVMPLPEGISELTFAGVLGNRRFRYITKDGYTISSDADFVITGLVYPNDNKPEGPFGDHLGYYSLKHEFPVLKVHKVYAKKNAIWPFTVVGRPPQEDTAFGNLIHEITGAIIPKEIPGLREIHAVDAAGVHPLLLAIGSERYTPYSNIRIPQEILTIANHILGFGQMSLAKYLFICASEDTPGLHVHNIENYFTHILQRINLERDIHFYTNTTIDTLDYSGSGLNTGSKVVFAAAGESIRTLGTSIPPDLKLTPFFKNPKLVLPGIIAIEGSRYSNEENELILLNDLFNHMDVCEAQLKEFPLIILCDDSNFTTKSLNNFLWVTFTRSNPSHDIHGIKSFIKNKHWGCSGSLLIDARIKPHHAPPLVSLPEIEKRVDLLGGKGHSLHGII